MVVYKSNHSQFSSGKQIWSPHFSHRAPTSLGLPPEVFKMDQIRTQSQGIREGEKT